MKTLLAGAICFSMLLGTQALAQDKGKASKGDSGFSQKVLHEDDKVRVTEATYKPGSTGPSVQRGYRIVRTLSGGTLERTYADGKKEKVEFKTGSVTPREPDKVAYANTNVGKTDVVFYSVNVKEAKK
jgi:hypothetical protein